MKQRDHFDLVAYTVHRINATVNRFILAETVVEQRQAMKWAKAWTQLAIRGPQRHSLDRPKAPH